MSEKTDLIIAPKSQVQDPLKKFYVYALIDGRDISEAGIFYIGKGTANRGNHHAADALRFDKLDMTEEDFIEGSAKIKRIREIRDSGFEPIVRVLGRYDTEQEAYAVEAILIQNIYGRLEDDGQLTNMVLGHNSRYVRRKGDFDELSRLDIPKNTRVDNGEYSKSNLDKLIKKGINEVVEETVEKLKLMICKDPLLSRIVKLHEPLIVESGRYIAVLVEFGEKSVILRLQFSSSNLTTNLRAVDEGIKSGRKSFSNRMKEIGLDVFNHGQYGWIQGWRKNPLKFNDYDGIVFRIKEVLKTFG